MNQFRVMLFVVLAVRMFSLNAHAQEAVPAAEEAAVAAAEPLPALDNLDFASGEVVSLDAATGKLDVKVYLDAAGDASEQTLSLFTDEKTEITNGETELKSDALKAGAEIDVEYDVNTKKATYIFVY